MGDAAFGSAFIAVVWVLFGVLVWHDQQALAGIFWPLVLTGLGLDAMEGKDNG